MINSLSIKNYKSVSDLDIEIGRLNVFIGANGSGKSNILEAIAMASAAATNKLDNEFMASRGIRVPEHPRMMRSAFGEASMSENIDITIKSRSHHAVVGAPSELDQTVLLCSLGNSNESPYSNWVNAAAVGIESLLSKIVSQGAIGDADTTIAVYRRLQAGILGLDRFLIYSPEHSALRAFDLEGQIQPLGSRGEGLFRLLTVMASQNGSQELEEVKREMRLLDWFDSFDVPEKPLFTESNLLIHDRFLRDGLESFTQRVANEGFLYLLFYFTLLISSETPRFFAVDNVDVSLNPRLCQELIRRMNKLSVEHQRQIILTTHNPSVLDGIDIRDDEQRLFVVYRNSAGHTKCRRIEYKEPPPDQEPVRLSEAFLRGYLGGLPKGF
jgi:predicted ATPase